MSHESITDDELLAYLDESLPVERAAVVEERLRDSESLQQRTARLAEERDAGAHCLGDIWRRHRVSCPTRSHLGSYLLGTLEADWHDYVVFHLQTVGCPYCAANLRDLQQSQQQDPAAGERRRKFFESSAGYIPVTRRR